ncbi:MAG: Gmad2 immunoglobulin-like domain-containing protein [Acidimicrobiales bacterium]
MTTTTANVTTTTLAVQPTSAIWPFASTPTRFATPMLAAQTFALDYLGFTNPIFEPFQQGDTRSGEVPVRTTLNGAVTTILVRQVTSDQSWWVIGAVSPNILISTPNALQAIADPVLVKGTSTAYEAVVNLEIRQDGSLTPLVRTTVMGGSMGVMGPFSKSVNYSTPSSSSGAIVMYTLSAKDGSVQEASVLRVAFKK